MTVEISDATRKSVQLMLESFDTFRAAEAERAKGNLAAYEAMTAKAFALRTAAFKLVFPDD